MKKQPEKYIPAICLAAMFLISWLSESFIFEGRSHDYLYAQGHVIIRSILRVVYIAIIFCLGYIGVRTFSLPWLKKVWIFWYLLALVTAGIRMLPPILFHQQLSMNSWSFLNSFYESTLTPSLFMFIWLLKILVKRKKEN